MAACMQANRCSHTESIGTLPGAMAFDRDMLVDVPLIANLTKMHELRQQKVDESARRVNAKRISQIFKVDDVVDVITCDPNKLEPRLHGPYRIVQVFTNGTVRIRKGDTEETVNIRKLFPRKS